MADHGQLWQRREAVCIVPAAAAAIGCPARGARACRSALGRHVCLQPRLTAVCCYEPPSTCELAPRVLAFLLRPVCNGVSEKAHHAGPCTSTHNVMVTTSHVEHAAQQMTECRGAHGRDPANRAPGKVGTANCADRAKQTEIAEQEPSLKLIDGD